MKTTEMHKILNFISEGKLNDYEDIVINLILNIKGKGFTISARHDCIISVINWSNKHIMISFKKEPLHIIWDILHEYGHLHQLPANEIYDVTTYDINREIDAWSYGYKELMKHEALQAHESNFIMYRDYCLTTNKRC